MRPNCVKFSSACLKDARAYNNNKIMGIVYTRKAYRITAGWKK